MIEVETVRELLKGTRPGPWVSPWELPDTAEDAELNRFITADGECVVGFPMEYHPDALWCTRENARLIAAAPDIAALALAQAAEIARLRDALEGLVELNENPPAPDQRGILANIAWTNARAALKVTP